MSQNTHASLIQRLRVAYRFWQGLSWRLTVLKNHFSWLFLMAPSRSQGTAFPCEQRLWSTAGKMSSADRPRGGERSYASQLCFPSLWIDFFFRGGGYFTMPQRYIDAAKQMLMRARWRMGAREKNSDQKTTWNFSSLIGGISRSWRLRKLESNSRPRFLISDTFEQHQMEYGPLQRKKHRMEK